jgi:hypothetical protein
MPKPLCPICPPTILGLTILLFVRSIALAEPPTVSEVLDQWSQKTAATTLDVRLMSKQLNPDGKFASEEPTPERFRYDRAAGIARLDRLAHPACTYILDAKNIIKRQQGAPEEIKPIGINDALATHLWIDTFPAFLLVGVDRATLERDFEIRSLQPSSREIQLYLYPQTRAHRERFQRLEVRLSASEKIAVELHVVWKDNSHTFWAIMEPKTDIALDPNDLRSR